MKAAVLHATQGDFSLEDIRISGPMAHEVLIEVRASGLCHSDQHVATVDTGHPLPAVLGHEVAGVVIATGANVGDLQRGDHVVTAPIHHCGRCTTCRRGRPFQCRDRAFTARSAESAPRLSADGQPVEAFLGIGGFAEQVVVHEHLVVKVPQEVEFDRACLLGCGVVTGAGAAINTAQIRPGDTVAVIGCGGVGLNVIQGALLAGAQRVIALDTQETKLELAQTFGATDVVNSSITDPVAAVRELTGGVTHAFEVVGLKPTTQQAVAMLEMGGTVYLIGVHRPGATIEVTPFGDLMGQQKGLRGVAMGSANPQIDIPRYAELYLQGRFMLDELVSRHISLGSINEAYAEMASAGVARNVITDFSK